MRRFLLILAVVSVILTMCACASQANEDTAEKIKEEYSSAESFDMTVSVTVSLEDCFASYKMNYTGTCEDGTIEILYPETVAGMKTIIEKGEIGLLIGETAVYLPQSRDLSPAAAPSVFIGAWQLGYYSTADREKEDGRDVIILTQPVDESVTAVTVFDCETLRPLRGELSVDGYMVFSCQFENVVLY